MAKRTTAQRRAAAKAVWARRRAATPDTTQAISTLDGMTAIGYDTLAVELQAAFDQSAYGKGKERHANAKPFDRQPIMELARMYGTGFTAGQAAKKAQEALGMLKRGENNKAIHELHGAIVYLAATAAAIREA